MIVGDMLVAAYDLKRCFKRSLAGKLLLLSPLSVMIERSLVRQCLKIDSQAEDLWMPADIPIPPTWGLFIVTEPKLDLKQKVTWSNGWSNEVVAVNLKYRSIARGPDLWIEIVYYGAVVDHGYVASDETTAKSFIFRYWRYSSCYLDELEDALWNVLEGDKDEVKDRNLAIEATQAVAWRLLCPSRISRLNQFLAKNNTKLVVIYRNKESKRPVITLNHIRTIPRLVVYPSNTYFFLLEIMWNVMNSQESENFAEKSLHRYGFKSIDWNTLTRKELFAITLLSGAWNALAKFPGCSICNRRFRTEELLSESCEHMLQFNIKGNRIPKVALSALFNNIKYISSAGLFLYRATVNL